MPLRILDKILKLSSSPLELIEGAGSATGADVIIVSFSNKEILFSFTTSVIAGRTGSTAGDITGSGALGALS